MAEVDLSVDLVHGPGGAEQRRFVIRPVALVETHPLADVLFHELLAGEEVVFVVLLEDLQAGGIREGLEVHARGIDEGGDVLKLHLRRSGRQARLANVLHQAEVAVVDRHGDVFLNVAAHAERGGPGRLHRDEHEREQSCGELRGHCHPPCPVRQGRTREVPARGPQSATRTVTLTDAGRSAVCCSLVKLPSWLTSRVNPSYAERGMARST